ncbi:MAG: hypothetical protein IPG54_03560 [Sphingomonadales bacterium]|nr:hypothetical protein [Sphingomonadales bacterium]MBK9003152.1 hypothetical protein [Sphingomonadales bacterium]MBK9268399.1 hypothetical protein [Sphingomonadales bacterium]
MAKPNISHIPLWGLSALAAGSFGASWSYPGQAGLEVDAVSPPKSHAAQIRALAYFRQTPSVLPDVQRSVRQAEAIANSRLPVKAEPGRNEGLAGLLDTGSIAAQSITGQPVAIASPALAAAKPDIGSLPPFSAMLPERSAVGIVDVPQVGALKSSANRMVVAAAAAVPRIPSDHAGAGMQSANDRAVYGTSAQNAYKVYFPQAEPSAPGNATDGNQTSAGSPEEDNRVLTRRGSYLFYEDAATSDVADNIKTSLNTHGAGSSKAVLDAIAAANKAAEAQELTSPPLQKQPLNFGDRSPEPSTQPNSQANMAAMGASNGGGNAER